MDYLTSSRSLSAMDKLDPNDTRPTYLQIADVVVREIRAGTYEPGAKLPPHHEMVEYFGVSLGTVKRAYAHLQDQRWIVTRQGQGAYVRDPLPETLTGEADGGFEGIYDQLATIRRLVDSVEHQLRALG